MAADTVGLDRGRLGWPRWGVPCALAVVAGTVLRVWTYRTRIGVPDSDEGLVGLMVRHILHGHIPTFFYGQAYGGSQEALLTAPVFAVFGSSWLALRIVPILLSALASLVIWRVGRRMIGEPAGAVAGALFWVWPPFMIDKLTHQWGFYASGVLYCGLLILLALRIVERPDRLRVGLFGLVLGLGFWQTTQLVPIAIPVIAWTVWRQPKALREVWIAAPLAVIGALPWFIWNLRHDWGSLSYPIRDTTDYAHRFRLFFSPVVPMMLGLRAPFRQVPILPTIVTDLVYAALIGLFIVGAYRSRRRDVSILYVIAAAFPFIYAINPETALDLTPGYIVILTPVLVLLLAQLATSYPRAIVLGVLAITVSAVTVHRMNMYDPWTNKQETAPRNLSPLISTLDRLGIDRVYANYWLAYVLSFDSGERIIAAQNQFKSVTFTGGQAIPTRDPIPRYPPYQDAVRSARHGFVFFRQGIADVRILRQLQQHGYRRVEAGAFVVYVPG